MISLFLGLSIILLVPGFAVSDCVDFGRATHWSVENENSIIYYSRMTPVARIVFQDCSVSPSSVIRLTKNYVCDEDSLIIDGLECAIMALTSASSGSF